MYAMMKSITYQAHGRNVEIPEEFAHLYAIAIVLI